MTVINSVPEDILDCWQQRIGHRRIIFRFDIRGDVSRSHALDSGFQGIELVRVLCKGEDRSRESLGLFSRILGGYIDKSLDLGIDEQPLVHAGRDLYPMLLQCGGRRLDDCDSFKRKWLGQCRLLQAK